MDADPKTAALPIVAAALAGLMVFPQRFLFAEPPQFVDESTQLIGARLLPNGIDGHDAAMMRFQVRISGAGGLPDAGKEIGGINRRRKRQRGIERLQRPSR